MRLNIDSIDLKLLKLLQENAHLSNQELADLVNLSTSACHRRIKILEKSGVIERYQAKISYKKLGIQVQAVVEIRLAQITEEDHDAFLNTIKEFEEVINAYIITGESNYLLFITTKDLNDFSQFVINKLNKIKGIVSINSKIILETAVQKSLL